MRQDYFKATDYGRNAKSAIRIAAAALALLGLSFVATAGAASAQTLASLPSASRPIGDLGTAKPIVGWLKFCEKFPSECTVDVKEPALVDLTPQIWKTIVSVNQRVNNMIEPVTDMEHWGVVDDWAFPDDGKGDCEDYQLLKRRMLSENGVPRRAMRMTVVIDELGEGHAVLMLRTNKGDYVLDNKTSSVLPWDRTGYVFIKRESQQAQAWVSLGSVTSPIVSAPTTTANR